jgi:hypothetical protein
MPCLSYGAAQGLGNTEELMYRLQIILLEEGNDAIPS